MSLDETILGLESSVWPVRRRGEFSLPLSVGTHWSYDDEEGFRRQDVDWAPEALLKSSLFPTRVENVWKVKYIICKVSFNDYLKEDGHV